VTARRRAYHSPAREARAQRTRERIRGAARRLFLARGYAVTTIPAIARAAGTSPKTVAAYFGSKQGLLASLLALENFGGNFRSVLSDLRGQTDPRTRVRAAAKLTRAAYAARAPEFELLRGASGVDRSLRAIDAALVERRRRNLQVLQYSVRRDPRAGPTASRRLDELVLLTSYDVYRSFVSVLGWSGDAYEKWLGDELERRLLPR
jgi:AcrR family transcriptional regulator